MGGGGGTTFDFLGGGFDNDFERDFLGDASSEMSSSASSSDRKRCGLRLLRVVTSSFSVS